MVAKEGKGERPSFEYLKLSLARVARVHVAVVSKTKIQTNSYHEEAYNWFFFKNRNTLQIEVADDGKVAAVQRDGRSCKKMGRISSRSFGLPRNRDMMNSGSSFLSFRSGDDTLHIRPPPTLLLGISCRGIGCRDGRLLVYLAYVSNRQAPCSPRSPTLFSLLSHQLERTGRAWLYKPPHHGKSH